MENAKRVVRELIEARAKALLAERSYVPSPSRLRVVVHRQDEPAEPAVLAADAVLPACPPTLVLTSRRGARQPGIDLPRRFFQCAVRFRCDDLWGAHAGQTAHGLGRSFVDRIALRRQLDLAHPAAAGVPKTHPLLTENPVLSHTRKLSAETSRRPDGCSTAPPVTTADEPIHQSPWRPHQPFKPSGTHATKVRRAVRPLGRAVRRFKAS